MQATRLNGVPSNWWPYPEQFLCAALEFHFSSLLLNSFFHLFTAEVQLYPYPDSSIF